MISRTSKRFRQCFEKLPAKVQSEARDAFRFFQKDHSYQSLNFKKVILITGTSSGFGMVTAARLASKGYRVVATMRDLSREGDLLQEVQERGGTVDVMRMDVTDVNSIEKCVEEVIQKYQRIDVLVNNAGYGVGGAFEDLTQEEICQNMEVNLFGVQNVTRAVLPQMRRQRSGRIINLSSISGLTVSPLFSAYNASKWALEAFSEALFYEVKPFGIHVSLIEPGTYPTKIFYDNAKYAKRFDDGTSPYYVVSQSLKKRVMSYVDSSKKNPETIAILIEKLIEKRNPALRNLPDWESRIMAALRRFLPSCVYHGIILSCVSKIPAQPESKKQR